MGDSTSEAFVVIFSSGCQCFNNPTDMFRHLTFVILAILSAGVCAAHDGLETDTEIRVRKDRIEITVRSSLVFLWKMLGDRAPADSSDASLEKVKPELRELGKTLVEMTAGGKPLKLRSADCAFELDEHAAFTLVYEVPPDTPEIRFKAAFFKNLGDMEEGNFRLIDLTQNPRRRDVEPLARKRLHRVDNSFAFVRSDEGVRVVRQAEPASASGAAPAVR